MGGKRRSVSIPEDEPEHRHSHDPGPGLSGIMEAVMRCARGEAPTTSWAGRRVSLAQVQQAFDDKGGELGMTEHALTEQLDDR
jgi:hypothetical protein